MGANWIVILTLVVYQLVLLGIGLWARRRAATGTGYFIGDRQLGPWVASLSYAAGSSSAWSILGVSGIAFSQGLGTIWIIPGTLLGHLVVWFWIAPRLYKISHAKGWITLTDLLVDGMGTRTAQITRILCAGAILFAFIFYIAAQFQGAANTFAHVFGFGFLAALVTGFVIVMLYTLWGGFWAVSVTDALQALLMLIAALALPLVAWWTLSQEQSLSTALMLSGSYGHWGGDNYGWLAVGFFLGMFSIGFGPLGQPHLLNRIMAMGSKKDILLARFIALGWFVIVLTGMYLLGLCGHFLVDQLAGSEQVFFVLADMLLPAAIMGVLVAAVLSAIMSTADSQLLVAGAAIQHDLLQNSDSTGAARIAVVCVGIAALLLALFLPESIFSRVLFAWNALGAAFGPLVLFRLARIRTHDVAIPLAIAVGFSGTVVFYLLPDGPGDVWERAVPFLLAVTILVSGRRWISPEPRHTSETRQWTQ